MHYTCDINFGGLDSVWILYCYFQPVCRDDLPDPKGLLSSTVPRQAIAEANKQVQEAAVSQSSKKRDIYGRFNVKTRAAIGTYSCENEVF